MKVNEANQEALRTLLAAKPVWVDVRPAIDVLPGMTKNTILHAGPPIGWKEMCGPQRNGIVNGIIYEGLAETREQAFRLIESGDIRVAPCHDYQAVGGMAGITTASTPVAVVLNETFGNYGYSQLFQGPSVQGVRWEDYASESMKQWRWLERVLGPSLGAAIHHRGGLEVKSIIARALQMGDECHNRSIAGSALLAKEIIPCLVKAGLDKDALLQSVEYLAKSDQFFLAVVMAAAKATIEPVKGVPHSTLVTTMARNGVEFGIKVSGLGDQWFTGPANRVEGLYFSSEWGPEDATPDIGDSAITETVGLGGFVQAAAPALQQFVGGTFRRAVELTQEMYEITVGRSEEFQLSSMDFEGAPVGIDIRKVVHTGITPIIDTAIAHKQGGVIGAGQVRAPMDCFKKALQAFARSYLAS